VPGPTPIGATLVSARSGRSETRRGNDYLRLEPDRYVWGPYFADPRHHLASRVATEVRVFPTLSMRFERSAMVDVIGAAADAAGASVATRRVDDEFQRGGDELLVVTRSAPTRPDRPEDPR
jgi:hypothetical protein